MLRTLASCLAAASSRAVRARLLAAAAAATSPCAAVTSLVRRARSFATAFFALSCFLSHAASALLHARLEDVETHQCGHMRTPRAPPEN